MQDIYKYNINTSLKIVKMKEKVKEINLIGLINWI